MMTNLPARSKGLIVLISLNPEVSTDVCKFLGQEAVNDLVLQLHRLPSLTMSLRQQVLDDFAAHSGNPQPGTLSTAELERQAKVDPEHFAKLLRSYSQMNW